MLIIIFIVFAVVVAGFSLYAMSLKNSIDTLKEIYDNLSERHTELCKQLDLVKRENKVLQEENARLNQAPKAEKIAKPRARKTTKK